MKQKIKQLQSSGETRKTNRTWHFLSTLNSLLLSKLLLLLIIPAIGSTAAQGAASTTSDGKYASGTIDFSTIGTLSANTTYWNNGVKFYSGNSTSVSANIAAWDEAISIPAYISNKKFGKNTSATNKWGSNGAGVQYTSSGFACNQHAIGIHVNSACTITVIVDKNRGSNTDDAGITASIDGVAYGTAYTSSNYKTAGSTALIVTSSRADAANYPGRYTLTINVTEENLTNGEAVVKMCNGSSGTGSEKLFCWESVSVTSAAPAIKYSVTYNLGDATGGTAPSQTDVAEGTKFIVADAPTDLVPPTGKTFMCWNDGTNNYNISRVAEAGPIYVAMRPIASANFTFSAIAGGVTGFI